MRTAEELLRAGRYREGFELYEARPTRLTSPIARAGFPEWRGEPLEGRTIAVWGEQGLGDEIQMIRFLRDLRRLKPRAILLGCSQPLMWLFRPLGADHLYNRHADVALPDFDYWVGLLSLPHRLGVTVETVDGSPYVARPRSERHGGLGLVWSGNPNNSRDRQRSLPSPDLLANVPGGLFLEPNGDMLESARQLAALDGLITVDTSWAHLAGAMGIPCSVLQPYQASDWRWGFGETTPWYDSVRSCRQPRPGDWPGAIAAAVEDQYARNSRIMMPPTPPVALVLPQKPEPPP